MEINMGEEKEKGGGGGGGGERRSEEGGGGGGGKGGGGLSHSLIYRNTHYHRINLYIYIVFYNLYERGGRKRYGRRMRRKGRRSTRKQRQERTASSLPRSSLAPLPFPQMTNIYLRDYTQ